MKLSLQPGQHRLRHPQQIAGYAFETVETLRVTIEHDGVAGRGEANGLYYRGETARTMAADVEALRGRIEQGRPPTRTELLDAMPAGGGRNALDCALFELESRLARMPVAALAGIEAPLRPIVSTRTLYADTPAAMAAAAGALAKAPLLKMKLLGDDHDAARLRAVRAARPDARLVVDANQGLDLATWPRLLPILVECGVELVEQPFPAQHDEWLDRMPRAAGLRVAADERALTRADLGALRGRVDVVNIKLDKCGGLTEALAMASQARALGFGLMVGCMCASSLAMAPAFLLAQQCDFADIDGPLYLERDVEPGLRYDSDATVHWTPGTWGFDAR